MWPPTAKNRWNFDTKYVVTTAIAVFAACLSLFNTYITSLRQVDDVSIVVGALPYLAMDSDNKRFDIGADETFIFINSGTRSVTVDNMALRVSQPSQDSNAPPNGCSSSETDRLNYDAEPFVVKPGEMVPKTITLSAKTHPTAYENNQYKITESGAISIPLSEKSSTLPRHDFRFCIAVRFTTTETDMQEVVVVDYTDYLDNDTGLNYSEKIGNSPPISLIKHSRLVWPWD
jgi:hypothetical protein